MAVEIQTVDKPSYREPLINVPKTPEKIIEEARWEHFPFSDFPVAGVAVQWGTELGNEELIYWLTQLGYVINPADIEIIGFKKRSSYPTSTTMQQSSYIEHNIGVQVVQKACEARGIEPKDLSAVYVSNSVPGSFETYPNDNFAEEISLEAGVSPKIKKVNVRLACNGSGEAMRRIGLRQNELEGKYVGIFVVEGLTKVAPRDGNSPIDPLSAAVFSNGGAGLVFQVGRDFIIDPGEFKTVPDDGSIVGPLTYTYMPNVFPDYDPRGYMDTGTAICQKLCSSEDGGVNGWMDARKTARWVSGQITPDFIGRMMVRPPEPDFNGERWVIFHHANYAIVHKLPELLLRRHQIDVKTKWYVDDGNSSSGTIPTAFLRAGKDGLLMPDRNVTLYSFGVGGSVSDSRVYNFQHR